MSALASCLLLNLFRNKRVYIHMGKYRMKLEDVRIASPCPTSWEQMLGDEKVRYCNICSKNVYNLSAMSRNEAQLLIHRMEGKLCGLIYTRKDGTVMTSDCPVGLAALRKQIFKRVAAVAAVVIGLLGGSTSFVVQKNRTMGKLVIRPPQKVQEMHDVHTSPDQQTESLGSLGYISER